ncbi:DNA polymerase III subunit gamma/tau [Lysobacter daejeonensis GH1-9]|uniref:DNA polymerase III subunit gamma/tau n=1 Tax=Lysobacter daejeonensis GH1-9 TaxID=1385517 RepID=A0A0A0EY93_9GAMM|nr:DNA polymerase III subunit gamma/tau [Lysobacter daejeonensis]KGM55484.1 DNA polymerase III subunit gamma/tau [Lysobacter daejeonensis GH1-9]
MSYLVLARKWRPKRFAELVGQEHVVRALTNALETGRVHHAFLFTGTRGVGKTTIARIFAKSLNCEQGTSSDPCGVCATCLDIDAGRFFDLIEIDAASNTGVDDVREVIENAQYMPSRGRVKVYLIDEVHMLSKAAFNALLKTLEEPPGHVKFLLATTDPQKLPVTVLSRCLQFNLKRLDEAQITGQMNRILEAEGIAVEPGAIRLLSKAADGSLRDGLSLLDQAIAYTGANSGGGQLAESGVATMLGSVDRTRVGALLAALADGNGEALLAEVAALADFSPDWGTVLDALSDAMHRIQVRQLVPTAPVESDGVDIDGLAARIRAEVIQLWYQMALNGRRDLPMAPSPRAGFEMTLLRMLAFRPADGGGGARAAQVEGDATRGSAQAGVAASAAASRPSAEAALRESEGLPKSPVQGKSEAQPVVQAEARVVRPTGPAPSTPQARPADDDVPPWAEDAPMGAPTPTPMAVAAVAVGTSPIVVERNQPPRAVVSNNPISAVPEPVPVAAPSSTALADADLGASIADADEWHAFVAASDLKGPARLLAEHAVFGGYADGVLTLALPEADQHLGVPNLVKLVAEALVPRLGSAPQIRFTTAAPGESIRERNDRARDERQAAAETTFMDNADVQRLIAQYGARVVPDSIRPLED